MSFISDVAICTSMRFFRINSSSPLLIFSVFSSISSLSRSRDMMASERSWSSCLRSASIFLSTLTTRRRNLSYSRLISALSDCMKRVRFFLRCLTPFTASMISWPACRIRFSSSLSRPSEYPLLVWMMNSTMAPYRAFSFLSYRSSISSSITSGDFLTTLFTFTPDSKTSRWMLRPSVMTLAARSYSRILSFLTASTAASAISMEALFK